MQPQDPLAQLRDIHLPESVSAWPPGPGWWVLALLLLLLIAAITLWLWRRHRSNAWRREALAALDAAFQEWQSEGDSAQFLQASQVVLKRAALRQFPNYDVARLSGTDWDAFLDRQWRKPPETGFASLGLAECSYQSQPELAEPAQYSDLCRRWLKQLAAIPC
ncbi:MAG: DUF4381 domain-containing protein [Pseudomonadota bacterium]